MGRGRNRPMVLLPQPAHHNDNRPIWLTQFNDFLRWVGMRVPH